MAFFCRLNICLYIYNSPEKAIFDHVIDLCEQRKPLTPLSRTTSNSDFATSHTKIVRFRIFTISVKVIMFSHNLNWSIRPISSCNTSTSLYFLVRVRMFSWSACLSSTTCQSLKTRSAFRYGSRVQLSAERHEKGKRDYSNKANKEGLLPLLFCYVILVTNSVQQQRYQQ